MHRSSQLSLLAILALTSCAHEVEVTYNCFPSGAYIREESIGEVGRCPAVLRYSAFDHRINDGVLYTNAIFVQWPSGASLLIPPTTLGITNDRKAEMNFYRPESPNLEKDIDYAISREKKVLTPEVTYVVAKNQRRDLFDSLNHSLYCGFKGLTRSTVALCP